MNWKIDRSWTLFLDRDGVINVRIPGDYVKNPEEFVFIEGVPESVAVLSEVFGHIFVVTNQQGIGKGIMTERNLEEVHDYMRQILHGVNGRIAQVYHAPALASEGSSLRKPETGMGLKAKEDFPEVDFERSVMVGDSDSDIEFGKRLGMKTVKIGKAEEDRSGADLCFETLVEFKNWLIR
jgi:D-glycero-D-manno-heptose 1,7-bisphosphate phosphatase